MKNLPAKIGLILLFILMFIPLYWMLMGSFQDIYGVMKMPPNIIPKSVTLQNYVYLLKEDAVKWLLNTIIVVGGTVVISVLLSITAGYAFGIYKFKGGKLLWTAYLSQLMIPRISLIIPLFVIIKKLGISGKLSAVIIPVAFSPMGIYLATNYFKSIPRSIMESARIDGASEMQVLRYIVAPISKPILSALALFSGIGALQDYLWQMLVLQKPERRTLLVGLMRKVMERGGIGELGVNPVGRSFAVGILLFFPLLLIFLVANKFFVESLGGSVKE